MGTPVTVEGWVSDPVDVHFSESLPPTPNKSGVTMQVGRVDPTGTPIQGPDIEVPDGFGLVVKARATQDSNNVLFVANSSANTADPDKRVELKPGEIIVYFVDNMNLLWFDGSGTAPVLAELTVEQ